MGCVRFAGVIYELALGAAENNNANAAAYVRQIAAAYTCGSSLVFVSARAADRLRPKQCKYLRI